MRPTAVWRLKRGGQVVEHATSYDAGNAFERGRCVLVVDDDDVQADSILRILQPSPVRIVTTGDQALQVLRSRTPIELLITDIDPLGPFDGFALARQARALRPGLRVIYTSMFPGIVRDDDFNSPDGELLLAPLSPGALRGAVDRVFQDRRRAKGG
jgi:CheY-like chemotaxis protein